jgi:hypothetical protein
MSRVALEKDTCVVDGQHYVASKPEKKDFCKGCDFRIMFNYCAIRPHDVPGCSDEHREHFRIWKRANG